jgi:DNA-binding sugar fermentation-stimulating protein
MSSLQENWRKRQNRFCLEARGVGKEGVGGGGQGGEMTQTMYVHMNIWIKREKKSKKKNPASSNLLTASSLNPTNLVNYSGLVRGQVLFVALSKLFLRLFLVAFLTLNKERKIHWRQRESWKVRITKGSDPC